MQNLLQCRTTFVSILVKEDRLKDLQLPKQVKVRALFRHVKLNDIIHALVLEGVNLIVVRVSVWDVVQTSVDESGRVYEKFGVRSVEILEDLHDVVPGLSAVGAVDGVDGIDEEEAVLLGILDEDKQQFEGCLDDVSELAGDQGVEPLDAALVCHHPVHAVNVQEDLMRFVKNGFDFSYFFLNNGEIRNDQYLIHIQICTK